MMGGKREVVRVAGRVSRSSLVELRLAHLVHMGVLPDLAKQTLRFLHNLPAPAVQIVGYTGHP